MGIFRQFPYTNFHDMNLNYILHHVQELIETWAEYHAQWEQWQGDTTAALDDLRQFVIESFETLNVDNAVRERIDAMLESGEFETLLSSFFDRYTKDYYVPLQYVTINNLMDLSVEDTYEMFEAYVTRGILTRTVIGYASSANTQVEDAEEDESKPIIMYSWVRQASRIHNFPISVLNRKILLTNAVHGNEKLGVPVMLTMLKDFEGGGSPYINWLFDTFNIDFVPVVNPYGYDFAIGTTLANVEDNPGRVNARGVNLNRNGNTAWVECPVGAGTYDYKGVKQYSEAESRAIRNLIINNNSQYAFYLDIHTERYATAQNEFGYLACSSSLARSIFGNVYASLYNRILNEYHFNILDDFADQTIISGGNSGSPMYSIDFYETNGETFTSAMYEGPRYNTIDGVKQIYPEVAQKFTTDIVVNFLYKFLKFQPEYRASRNTSYNVERLLNRAMRNLAPIEPYSWMYGAHTDVGFSNSTQRITTKNAIVLDGVSTYRINIFSITHTDFMVSACRYQNTSDFSSGIWNSWNHEIIIDSSQNATSRYLYLNVRSEPSQFLITEEVNTDYIVTCVKI